MDNKRKIAIALGNAEKPAMEAIYKNLVDHQVLDHVHVTFFAPGPEGLQQALEEATKGYDALIAMPMENVDIPKLWRQKWTALNDSLQISIHGNLRYIKLIAENSNDVGFLPEVERLTSRIEHFAEMLKVMFRLPLPRLAVMSTAKTTEGKATKEDKERLLPAIQRVFEKLIPVFGTFSNEMFFASENFLRFDGLCFVNQEQADACFGNSCYDKLQYGRCFQRNTLFGKRRAEQSKRICGNQQKSTEI